MNVQPKSHIPHLRIYIQQALHLASDTLSELHSVNPESARHMPRYLILKRNQKYLFLNLYSLKDLYSYIVHIYLLYSFQPVPVAKEISDNINVIDRLPIHNLFVLIKNSPLVKYSPLIFL